MTLIKIAHASWQQIFGRALVRPFLMFYRESIIQLLGIYAAFMYALNSECFALPCLNHPLPKATAS